LDKEAIDIHSRYEVPGAAEYLLKDKDFWQEEPKQEDWKFSDSDRNGSGLNYQ
jgi:hypothetical protein